MDQTITANGERFTLRPYRDEDEEAVVGLWQSVFGKAMSREYWRWKYTENPYGQRILLCLTQAGKPIVAYGGIPYRARLENEAIEIIQLMDIMSHPDYRKTGLFIKTAEGFFREYGGPEGAFLLYGLPGPYHFEVGQKYLAYERLEPAMQFLSCKPAEMPIKVGPDQVFRVTGMDDRMNSAWAACAAVYPFSVIRDAAFVNWRFHTHPLNNYEILGYGAPLQSSMAGYAVFYHDTDKSVMVDCLSPPDADFINAFWAAIGDEFKHRGIPRIDAWLPENHFLTGGLKDCGFVAKPEPIGFIPTVRFLNSWRSLRWVSDQLYYTMADSDLF